MGVRTNLIFITAFGIKSKSMEREFLMVQSWKSLLVLSQAWPACLEEGGGGWGQVRAQRSLARRHKPRAQEPGTQKFGKRSKQEPDLGVRSEAIRSPEVKAEEQYAFSAHRALQRLLLICQQPHQFSLTGTRWGDSTSLNQAVRGLVSLPAAPHRRGLEYHSTELDKLED